MKTKVLFNFAAITAFTVLSCHKENTPLAPVENEEPVVVVEAPHNPLFEATTNMTFVGIVDEGNDPETKTILSGANIRWAAAEKVYLFDDAAPRAFTSTNADEASTVNFTGPVKSSDKYYAIYPSGKIRTESTNKIIKTTIPVIQAATEDSFAPKANVAVAYSTSTPTGEGVLQFKNIGAVLKFKLNADNDNVCKIRIDAIGGAKMTGEVDVTFDGEGTFTTSIINAKAYSYAILDNGNVALDPSKTYYLSVYPGTYTGGFRITLYKSDGKSYRAVKNTKDAVLDRNDLMDLGDLPKIADDKWKTPDVLTASSINKASYGDWTNKKPGALAVYAGNSQTSNSTYDNSIQIRGSSNSGIVTTTSGGQAKKVVINWQSGTSDGRTLNVYGKKSAYSSAADLYNASEDTSGKLLGTIVKGTSTELAITGDYTYIGLRSDANAMYINSIYVYWDDATPIDPIIATQTTSITSLSSNQVGLTDGSATFTVESNGPWTIASDSAFATVSVDESDEVTVLFENLASGTRDAVITVTPAEGDSKSVTIKQKDIEATHTYSYTINLSDFSNNGYGKSMNTITATATDSSGATFDVDHATSNAGKQNSSVIQFKTNVGMLYNTTDLGTVNSVSMTSVTGGSLTVYKGSSQNPTSAGSGGYFTVKETGGATTTCTSITVTFTK